MKLSKHFTLSEAVRSQTADRKGIDNTPRNDLIIQRLSTTAEKILEPCREHYGRSISPSSWYRCLELNTAIGSLPSSSHVKGFAVDFEIAGVDNLDLAYFIHDSLDFDQLILEFYSTTNPSSGWVHASYVSSETNRGEVLTISANHTITSTLPGNNQWKS